MTGRPQRYEDFVWLFDAWQQKRLKEGTPQRPVDFYRKWAESVDGPALEVGAGVGRIYLELLADDVDVHGIDLSADMLERLREKAAARGLDPSVRVADVTDFEPEREYGLVYMARSFKYLSTLSDQRAALRNVHDALAPDGLLVLDSKVPCFDVIAESTEPQEDTFEIDGVPHRVVTYLDIQDEVEQVACWHLEGYREGELLAEHEVPIAMTPKRQFELLFGDAGFEEWTAYGDYDGTPLGPSDTEMAWVVQP